MSSATPARRVAYEVLRRVFEHGAWADRTLRSAAERAGLEGRNRRHAQRLAYGAVQRRGTCDHFAAELSGRPVRRIDAPLLAALRLGLYELLFEPPGGEHAAVDAAVELAKGGGRGPRARGAGLVNAVLRRAGREREALLAGLSDADPQAAAIAHSVPPWVAELWWQELGEEAARGLLQRVNEPPRRTFRVNPLREREAGLLPGATPVEPLLGEATATLLEAGAETAAELAAAVERGELIPQSPGSAAAVELLAPLPGEHVLDLCAAPGIKTTQIAAAVGPGGRLVAIEQDPGRAGELGDLCVRAGASAVEVREGDARRLDLGGGYDRVLVDAPCTGLGTLASRPDVRWRRRPGDIPELAYLQAELLDRALSAVRPGGTVLYSVCTVSRREGVGVIGTVASGRDDVVVEDLGSTAPAYAVGDDRRFLQLLPGRDRSDGFFFARLRRRQDAG